jgi:hypothetical protein
MLASLPRIAERRSANAISGARALPGHTRLCRVQLRDRYAGRPETESQLTAFRCPDPNELTTQPGETRGVVLGVFDDRVELRPAGDGVETLAGPP